MGPQFGVQEALNPPRGARRPPTALFWDLGGVVLTDGWDRQARRRAIKRFRLDPDEFAQRHAEVSGPFERGEISLHEYITHAVFYVPRRFARSDFRRFMFAQSRAIPPTTRLLERLAASPQYLQATLNNESLELNLYRIKRFRLRRFFSLFVSSSFVGIQKPDERIYRLALQLTQRSPGECIFIDDRLPNVQAARKVGMAAIHYRNPTQLRAALLRFHVAL